MDIAIRWNVITHDQDLARLLGGPSHRLDLGVSVNVSSN